MLKLYSKKSFLFQNGEEEQLIINESINSQVKDWVAETALFKLAVADGSIEVIESASQQRDIEKGSNRRNGRNKGNTDRVDNAEQNIVEESSTEDK